MNIQHRMSNSPQASKHLSASGGSNVECETEIAIQGPALVLFRFQNNLKSVATSLFEVRRSMLDVGRSSFKTITYSINIICER